MASRTVSYNFIHECHKARAIFVADIRIYGLCHELVARLEAGGIEVFVGAVSIRLFYQSDIANGYFTLDCLPQRKGDANSTKNSIRR